jgi:magnesium transporter
MLINCVAYQEGRKLADISVEAISDYVAQPGCFVWVGLSDATPEEMAVMKEEFGLHELAVEDALRGQQRPKIEEYGESLFVVLHTVEHDDDELSIGEVDIFVGPNYVLSARRNVKRGFHDVRRRAETESELLAMGSAFVLYALMDAVVDRYFPIVEMFEGELDALEERIFTMNGSQRENMSRLYELKRKSLSLRHAVAPLIEAVGRLHGGRVPPFCAQAQDYFRDVHDHLYRISAALDSIRETINTAIQVSLSMVSIEEAEVGKRLAAWAAIFAVFTAVAGVWGMNFEVMPELKWRYGYLFAMGLIFSVCGYLYYRFKKARWL